MNISYILICLWFLESSSGKNFKHPDPTCVGHLGIKPVVVRDANRIVGWKEFKLSDRENRLKSFRMASLILFQYSDLSWELKDYFLLWRCGVKGMKNPTKEQIEYAQHGISLYNQLRQGAKLKELK